MYSKPNNITFSEVNINSMNISWIPNINLTGFSAIEYKDVATGKWHKTNYTKMNYNEKIIHRTFTAQNFLQVSLDIEIARI